MVQTAKNRRRNGDQNNYPCPVDWLLVTVRYARISNVSTCKKLTGFKRANAEYRGVRHGESSIMNSLERRMRVELV
jgi:hypothetical protein